MLKCSVNNRTTFVDNQTCTCCSSNTISESTRVVWNDEYKEHVAHNINDHRECLNTIFNDMILTSDADTCVNRFTSVMQTVFEVCMKKYKTKCLCSCHNRPKKNNVIDQPWFDEECKRLRYDYLRSLNTFNNVRSAANRELLSQKRREYKVCTSKCKRRFEQYEGDHMDFLRKNNPKQFFRQLRNTSTPSSGNTDLTLDDFREHFSTLSNVDGHDENNATPCPTDMSTVYPELDADFTMDELKTVLKNVKKNKTAGIDCMLNEFFTVFTDVFSPYLLQLFNVILQTGVFPESWSSGIIVPLHKKGDVNMVNNYRGITLLSHVAKIFTSLINNRLLSWSKVHNIITDAQFGFKLGFGTRDAIFVLHSLVYKTLTKKEVVLLFC